MNTRRGGDVGRSGPPSPPASTTSPPLSNLWPCWLDASRAPVFLRRLWGSASFLFDGQGRIVYSTRVLPERLGHSLRATQGDGRNAPRGAVGVEVARRFVDGGYSAGVILNARRRLRPPRHPPPFRLTPRRPVAWWHWSPRWQDISGDFGPFELTARRGHQKGGAGMVARIALRFSRRYCLRLRFEKTRPLAPSLLAGPEEAAFSFAS